MALQYLFNVFTGNFDLVNTSGGGGGSPGGVFGSIQYNDGMGGFAGATYYTNDGTDLISPEFGFGTQLVNLISHSSQLDNVSVWNAGGVVTYNNSAPDGSFTALLNPTFISPTQSNTWTGNISTTAVPYTMSAWLKGASGGEQVVLRATTSTPTVFTSSPITLTTDWVRYQFTFTPDANITSLDFPYIDPIVNSYMWGPQLEIGSQVGVYVPTGPSAISEYGVATTNIIASRAQFTGDVHAQENVYVDGKVGINDNSPGSKLSVQDTTATQIIAYGYSPIGAGAVGTDYEGSIAVGKITGEQGIFTVHSPASGSSNVYILNTYLGSNASMIFGVGAATNILTMTQTGFVGINNGNPLYYLDVAGTINLTSTLSKNDVPIDAFFHSPLGSGLDSIYSYNARVPLGHFNFAVGQSAGGTTGEHNIFIGYTAGTSNTGSGNIFLGYNAGYNNTSGTNNIFFGYNGVGASISSGTDNIIIGTAADMPNGSNQLNIGSVIFGTSINIAPSSGNIGICNTSPSALLHLGSSVTTRPGLIRMETGGSAYHVDLAVPSVMGASYVFTFPGNAGTSGYALITDGSANTSWALLPSSFWDLAGDGTSIYNNNNGGAGFVGIGTNTPAFLLDVAGTINSSRYNMVGGGTAYMASDGDGGINFVDNGNFVLNWNAWDLSGLNLNNNNIVGVNSLLQNGNNFAFYNDGSGLLSNNAINWNASGDLVVDSITVAGTSTHTYIWTNDAAAPSTSSLALPLSILVYGGTSALLGDPADWVLVNIAGTDRKIPAYAI